MRASADRLPYPIVEPAHMELAEPSIGTAFDRCVARRRGHAWSWRRGSSARAATGTATSRP